MRPSQARLERPHKPRGLTFRNYEDADIFNVVIAAAAQEHSIDSVCGQPGPAPQRQPGADLLKALKARYGVRDTLDHPFVLSVPIKL